MQARLVKYILPGSVGLLLLAAAIVVLTYGVHIVAFRSVIPDIDGMMSLAISLLSYQDSNGHLPPAEVKGVTSSGELKHSWRALLLRYSSGVDVEYDFTADWSSEVNNSARRGALACYCTDRSTRSHGKCVTSFLTVTGHDTAFAKETARRNTNRSLPKDQILVIGGSKLPISPLEPHDLSIADLELAQGTIGEMLDTEAYIVILFGDLSIWVISDDTPSRKIALLATRSGAQQYDRADVFEPWLIKIVP